MRIVVSSLLLSYTQYYMYANTSVVTALFLFKLYPVCQTPKYHLKLKSLDTVWLSFAIKETITDKLPFKIDRIVQYNDRICYFTTCLIVLSGWRTFMMTNSFTKTVTVCQVVNTLTCLLLIVLFYCFEVLIYIL